MILSNETRAICMAQLVMSSGKHPGNINPIDVKSAYDVMLNIENELATRDAINAKTKLPQASKISSGPIS